MYIYIYIYMYIYIYIYIYIYRERERERERERALLVAWHVPHIFDISHTMCMQKFVYIYIRAHTYIHTQLLQPYNGLFSCTRS